MSKIKQLVFTSTPIGLEPGRSGYCTVARSQDLSKKEISEIERLSVLDYSISKSSPPKIYSFRIVQTKSSFFYLLSRIKSCGIDYSNRTNYIAHHLIIDPESINNLHSPSEIFQFWEGWKDNWEEPPKYLHDDLLSELSELNPENQSSCNSWQIWTGDSKNSKIPLKGYSIFRTQKNEEDKLINLFSESCSSLDQKENSWNYTFTTFLQPTDDSVDFIWIGGWENSPADKIGITPEIHFFDLDRFDESLIHETELPITKEVQEEANSPSLQSEENTTNLESEIKDRLQSDEPNFTESSILEESIKEEEPANTLYGTKRKETTDTSSWKPEQQDPIYKPVENVPIEQSNEQITEQTQSAKSPAKSESNEKPTQVSEKTISNSSKAKKTKDFSIQKSKSLNENPRKKSDAPKILFFVVIAILFCVIFFLLGKVNELEMQNNHLNKIIKLLIESCAIEKTDEDKIITTIRSNDDSESTEIANDINEGPRQEFDESSGDISNDRNNPKKAVIVILGATEFNIGLLNDEYQTIQVNPSTYYERLGTTLTSYDNKKNFFVYFFRPSACETTITNVPGRNGTIQKNLFDLLCDPKNNLTRMIGFKYGFEPIHEDVKPIYLFNYLKSQSTTLPQQKDTRKKPLPVIVAHGKMYPMISIGIGSVEKNEDGLSWNQTPDKRFQVKVDSEKGVDPMNEDALDFFLSSVRDAPRSVRQAFFLNLFVYSDSENFAIFNKIRDEAVLRKLDYNWIPISELPLILRSDNVPWKIN
jgi:hypothetical protein